MAVITGNMKTTECERDVERSSGLSASCEKSFWTPNKPFPGTRRMFAIKALTGAMRLHAGNSVEFQNFLFIYFPVGRKREHRFGAQEGYRFPGG